MEELSYRSAGVDIAEATSTLTDAKQLIRSTFTPGVLSDVGSFGGMFSAAFPDMREPVLVASIDGVGTKTLLVTEARHLEGIGADLVYHSVNDILVQGARPLFFLDYFGTQRLRGADLSAVLGGVARACREVECALLGGETAEMADVYAPGQFELAGCIVGVVEKSLRLPRAGIALGDVLIGLASNGLHTNGYTLARHALSHLDLDKPLTWHGHLVRDPNTDSAGHGQDAHATSSDALTFVPSEAQRQGEATLREVLLRPHRCYLNAILPVLPKVLAIAHITGGGLVDNIPRILPPGLSVAIDRASWTEPQIFELLRASGIAADEMLHVFNLGVGMVLIARRDQADAIVSAVVAAGESAWHLGQVVSGNGDVQFD